jgi:hypothetical protein
MRMDSKVHGTLIRNKDGQEIPEDEFVAFRPADNAVPSMLAFYRNKCIELGASAEQISAILALETRVSQWRELHPERCKVADVQPGELRLL